MRFIKADKLHQVVYGEVYIPAIPDSQGDFMSAEAVQEMAWDFLRGGRTAMVDLEHDNKLYGCAVVESFVAREGDHDFIPGSWVAGIHVPSPELWAKIETNEINGFSFQGIGASQSVEIELEIPDEITGKTEVVAGHEHAFAVRYGPDGKFLGGNTAAADGHTHLIKRGTLTEPGGSDGHCHRFTFVEQLALLQAKG